MAARDRAHFLAIAARAMRQVLVDQARDRKAAKRGGGEWERTTLTDGAWAGEFDPDGVLALDEALGKLEPRQRQVVECRFFGGMEEQEIAAALGRLRADGAPRLDQGAGVALSLLLSRRGRAGVTLSRGGAGAPPAPPRSAPRRSAAAFRCCSKAAAARRSSGSARA